jgi:glycosyltransferase involved in cell wall biosynthesis
MNEARPLVIVGALPPPVSGYSLITAKVRDLASGYRKAVCLDISPGTAERGPRYHFNRVRRVGWAIVRLIALRASGASELYIATESRIGLLYTIALSATARLCGYRLWLHHHVFRYIMAKSSLMAMLVRLAGRRTTHIFLCRCMERDFVALYGAAGLNSVILTNAAFAEWDPAPAPTDAGARPVTIGLLSNLTREKGLYHFLSLAALAKRTQLSLRFVLAGPVGDARDRNAIAAARATLDGMFEYRGAIYGSDKARFYRDIDLFAFPTEYENEAQPLVLYEAMAGGCAVISYDRGCIAEQVGDAGFVIAPTEDFAARALERIEALAADRSLLEKIQRTASLRFREEREKALSEARSVIGAQ